MQDVVAHLRLPFRFDETKLVHDLQAISQSHWQPHFNTHGYQGEWNVIPLYAPGGDARNIFAYANTAEPVPVAETELLHACPYFKEVIDTFECPILSARILRLAVGAVIKPHQDHELGYEDGTFRIHVPIITNPGVHFMLHGQELTMLPGECWYTNVNLEHSVRNDGEADRFHLVIDGERNAWSDALFFSLASEESLLTPPQPPEDVETLRRTVEELKRMENPAIQPLIAEIEEKLKLVQTR